jgi:integrase
MAIDRKEYINNIKAGLKANKDYRKFFYRFKIEGKTYYTVFDYKDKNWDKRTRISQAETQAKLYRDNKINPVTEIDEDIKLDSFITAHFDTLDDTTWTTAKKNHYKNYIKKSLGNKKVKNIKQMHIKECIKLQQNLGLAPRTVKTTLEVLNPVFKEAMVNRLIDFNPCMGINIKLPKTKKIVIGASDELLKIRDAIYQVHGDNPLFLSFFLFALNGRRKSEILNLKWENIDYINDRYIIEDTKNGEHQMFFLPELIKNELLKFNNEKGFVYESSINPGNPIVNIKTPTNAIKKIVPYFTLHYLRNIIVSAMAENGLSATLMSGAIGHNNTATLSKYLSLNYVQGSKMANETIENILKKDIKVIK